MSRNKRIFIIPKHDSESKSLQPQNAANASIRKHRDWVAVDRALADSEAITGDAFALHVWLSATKRTLLSARDMMRRFKWGFKRVRSTLDELVSLRMLFRRKVKQGRVEHDVYDLLTREGWTSVIQLPPIGSASDQTPDDEVSDENANWDDALLPENESDETCFQLENLIPNGEHVPPSNPGTVQDAKSLEKTEEYLKTKTQEVKEQETKTAEPFPILERMGDAIVAKNHIDAAKVIEAQFDIAIYESRNNLNPFCEQWKRQLPLLMKFADWLRTKRCNENNGKRFHYTVYNFNRLWQDFVQDMNNEHRKTA